MLFIEYLTWCKLLSYAEAAYNLHKSEISGMAVILPDELEIIDPVILKQKVTGTTTKLDKEALAMYHAQKLSENPDYCFLWWHTHPKFKASFSMVDKETIAKDIPSRGKFTAALVFNLEGEYELQIDVAWPTRMTKTAKLHFLYEAHNDDDVEDEVKELLTVPTYPAYTPKNKWGNYGLNHIPTYDEREDDRVNSKQTSLVKAEEVNVYNDKVVDIMDEMDTFLDLFKDGDISYETLRNEVTKLNLKLRKHKKYFHLPGKNFINYYMQGKNAETAETLLREDWDSRV
jgi:hypothetical protein